MIFDLTSPYAATLGRPKEQTSHVDTVSPEKVLDDPSVELLKDTVSGFIKYLLLSKELTEDQANQINQLHLTLDLKQVIISSGATVIVSVQLWTINCKIDGYRLVAAT